MPIDNNVWIYDQISLRDAEVAARYAEDMTVAEIAEEIGIARSTVGDHLRHIRGVIDGEAKRDVARWWREERDAYHARLRQRLRLDDGS